MVDMLLRAERVVRRYGARAVVSVDSLDVLAGEVLAIVGPNGAGKSTLFRLLLGLERPDEGSVVAQGTLAGVFQRPILFTGTVLSNVAFGLRARGISKEMASQQSRDALSWLGLDSLSDAAVHTLSGGEAQRVALARALVLEPDVLLLDEPTSSLDVTIRRRLREDLERVARRHARSIVIITHDVSEAFGLANRVAVMDAGRIVQLATPEQIMLRPGSPFVAELTGAELVLVGIVEQVEEGLVAVRIGADLVLLGAGDGFGPGDAAVVGYRAEDVVLSAESEDATTSAVNRIPVVVEAIVPTGALVRVRVAAGDITLTALLTRRSVETLGLAPGRRATAHLKAAALHAWHREPARSGGNGDITRRPQ